MPQQSKPEPTKTQERLFQKLSSEERKQSLETFKKSLPYLKLQKPESQQETVH
jgi:hypothetical protein